MQSSQIGFNCAPPPVLTSPRRRRPLKDAASAASARAMPMRRPPENSCGYRLAAARAAKPNGHNPEWTPSRWPSACAGNEAAYAHIRAPHATVSFQHAGQRARSSRLRNRLRSGSVCAALHLHRAANLDADIAARDLHKARPVSGAGFRLFVLRRRRRRGRACWWIGIGQGLRVQACSRCDGLRDDRSKYRDEETRSSGWRAFPNKREFVAGCARCGIAPT